MSETLPPLVDEEALQRYLDEKLPGEGALSVQRHRAGHSNETFFVRRGGSEWVLRRPPRGAFLPTAHDVEREYRVLSALQSTPARVPRTIAMCSDTSVIGAPFYLMEKVDGVVIRESLPEFFSDEDRAQIGDELVDTLVELHAVVPEPAGLASFGKPSGYLERQLRRWTGQMQLTLPLTRPVEDLEKVGRWLAEYIPASPPTTIVHGDYKLDNVMFTPASPPRLIAILDWEMSTLGDPLADLGWMISFWREPGDEQDLFSELNAVTALPGFRSRSELIDRYSAATRVDVDHVDWYVVLAIWKLAILLEGSYARHLAGMTDDPFFARMETAVPALAARAREIASA